MLCKKKKKHCWDKPAANRINHEVTRSLIDLFV